MKKITARAAAGVLSTAVAIVLGVAPAAAQTTPAATGTTQRWISVAPATGRPGQRVSVQVACAQAAGAVRSAALTAGGLARDPAGHQPWAQTTSATVRAVEPGRYPVSVRCAGRPLATTFTVEPSSALLTGVRVGAHPGFDEVVLDLAGPVPAVADRYVPRLTADPSGLPVALPCTSRNETFLLVTARPAAAHDSAGGASHHGRATCTPKLANVRAVGLTGDFEGVLSVGLGLRHPSWVRVLRLTDPTRVVVHVGH